MNVGDGGGDGGVAARAAAATAGGVAAGASLYGDYDAPTGASYDYEGGGDGDGDASADANASYYYDNASYGNAHDYGVDYGVNNNADDAYGYYDNYDHNYYAHSPELPPAGEEASGGYDDPTGEFARLQLDAHDDTASAYVWDAASGTWALPTYAYDDGGDTAAGASYFTTGEEPEPMATGDEELVNSEADGEASALAPMTQDAADEGLPPTGNSAPTSTPPSASAGDSTPGSRQGGGARRHKAKKTRAERIRKRQEALEQAEEAAAGATGGDATPAAATTTPTAASNTQEAHAKQPVVSASRSFVQREKARFQLRLRQARAIARKRIPVQVRILTAPRRHLSPMDVYFGGAVEPVLADLYWAAAKRDLRRVRHLVEIEGARVGDATGDPWNMQQTPLHWAAKGGSAEVIEYLLRAGANPRCLDESGSLPLHVTCWAGHVDATLALLRATDTRDLYVPDYDAALAPLDWANLRGHHGLVRAIEKYEDTLWLPKFVDDLIRGIIRYKIKLFKPAAAAGGASPTGRINFRRLGAAAPAAAPDATNAHQSQGQGPALTADKAPESPEAAPAPNGPVVMP